MPFKGKKKGPNSGPFGGLGLRVLRSLATLVVLDQSADGTRPGRHCRDSGIVSFRAPRYAFGPHRARIARVQVGMVADSAHDADAPCATVVVSKYHAIPFHVDSGTW